MKKIVIEKPGGYERLTLKEAVLPSIKSGELLIETAYSGVNFADCCVRMGVYSSAKEYVGWPIVPGFEVSGTVAAVGEGVSKFKVGDQVIGLTRFFGYASHVALGENFAFPIPKGLSLAEAAAFPAVFLTAYYALFELAHPRPGASVLIHSAAGGVGSALVQLAKLSGCTVTGVVGRSDKRAYVESLGADHVIDKSSEELWRGDYDLILDANGIETLNESYNHLKPGGKLVVYGFHTMFTKGRGKLNWVKAIFDYLRTPRFNPLYMTSANKSVLAFNLSYLFDHVDLFKEAMEKLSALFEAGRLKAPMVTVYNASEVQEAHRALESGNTQGKLVLQWNLRLSQRV